MQSVHLKCVPLLFFYRTFFCSFQTNAHIFTFYIYISISFCVQILLNSTSWELETHAEAYIAMKKKLGLDEEVFLSHMKRVQTGDCQRALLSEVLGSSLLNSELLFASSLCTKTPFSGSYTTPGVLLCCHRDGAMFLLQLWLSVVACSPVCRRPNTVRCD